MRQTTTRTILDACYFWFCVGMLVMMWAIA